jgi:hypothetical protein
VKTKRLPAFAIAIAFGAMIYTGCKKEDDTPVPAETTTERNNSGINDVTAAEASFGDAIGIISSGSLPDLANTEPNSITPWRSPCAVITVDMNITPHRAVIDFGDGCLGNDGSLRKGKIFIYWEGAYIDNGSYFVINFEKYELNNNKIDGEARIRNHGFNQAGNLVFNYDAVGYVTIPEKLPMLATQPVASKPAMATMNYEFHGTREWTSGMMTTTWEDDVYMIRGYSIGKTLGNQTFRADIVAPLRNEIGFPFYTRGKLDLKVNDMHKLIDYGYLDNARDDLASVTVGDVISFIHLNKNPLMIVNIR